MDGKLRDWVNQQLANCYKEKMLWGAYYISLPPGVTGYKIIFPKTIPSTLPGRWWLNEEINEQVERYRNELYNLKRKWPPEFAEFQECNYCTFVIDELLRIAPYYMYGYFLVLNAIRGFNENISIPISSASFKMVEQTNAAFTALQERDLDRRIAALCHHKGCGILFASRDDLKTHKKQHKLKIGGKIFCCPFCQMHFEDVTDLETHRTKYLHLLVEQWPLMYSLTSY